MLRRTVLAGLGLAFASLVSGCQPELVVGKVVESSTCSAPDVGAGGGSGDGTIDIGWSTSFENGFCDYTRVGGSCYNLADASYAIVEEPAPHTGSSAAAFSVTTDASGDDKQTRCSLKGTLPPDAVYGAWFYVPALAQNTGNWNLFHFRDAAKPPPAPGLWDVSLGNTDDGNLVLYLFDFLNGGGVSFPTGSSPQVPIATWFHVRFRLRRATDATGEVQLYQDDVLVMSLTNVITDPSESAVWFVGNLADALMPPQATLYVDDVSVTAP